MLFLLRGRLLPADSWTPLPTLGGQQGNSACSVTSRLGQSSHFHRSPGPAAASLLLRAQPLLFAFPRACDASYPGHREGTEVALYFLNPLSASP